MAPPKVPGPTPTRLTGRQKREMREQRRREKMFRDHSRKMGLRERIIGCGFGGLIVGGVVFLLVLIVSAIWYWGFDR